MENIKAIILTVIGLAGGYISTLFGGWDMALQTLIIFMAVDYVSGLVVAGIFKKSQKSPNGALESKAGFKGLFKKGMALLIVLVAAQLDKVVGTDFIRNAVIIAYIANETVSITENAGLMGVHIPGPLMKAIDLLNQKVEEDNKDE